MNAVHVNAGGKQIGSSSQRQRSQVTTVAATPRADACSIHEGPAFQIESGAQHVVKLTCSRGAIIERTAEVESIADAAPVVHTEHDIAEAGQILVHGVGIRVILHVMPAE